VHPDSLPGRGVALGVTLAIVGLVVVMPLAAVVATIAGASPAHLAAVVFSPRALASYRLTFGASFAAALCDVALGLLVAWVLVRHRFPGRAAMNALVDVPFALPTAVTGITLATLYGPHGIAGTFLARFGVRVAYTPLGVVLALAFIGLPFVVRSVAPVIEALPAQYDEAALTLGASAATAFRRVTLPLLAPALLSGFALALARGLGEYGSVIFIAGNLPGRTEIAPLLIVAQLEQFDNAGAAGIALVVLAASLGILLAVNGVERRLGAARGAV